jgi:quercetin dioxygenase-like cupin family protein
MIRQNALVNLTDNICASRMIAKPHTASAVHHHADEDTIVFAFSGRGAVVSEGGKKRHELAPGDYALIPAYAEHQEVNDGDEEVVWCIVRSGREPKVVSLLGWMGQGGGYGSADHGGRSIWKAGVRVRGEASSRASPHCKMHAVWGLTKRGRNDKSAKKSSIYS